MTSSFHELGAYLTTLAEQAMQERGLEPAFPPAVLNQLTKIQSPAKPASGDLDLRSLLWCSIDNVDSRDLDQLTYGETNGQGVGVIWVAIADVDALIAKDSAIDQHARNNTTSVYTPAKIFPMLPEKLSTDFTSLNEDEERVALVVKVEIDPSGECGRSSIFPALVRNHAKLNYDEIGLWLEGQQPLPDKVRQKNGLEQVLQTQHQLAQRLKKRRHEAGSLTLRSSEAEVRLFRPPSTLPAGETEVQVNIQLAPHNFAHQLIEEFMIAANRAVAQTLKAEQVPCLRRIVRTPKYWDRIVEVARSYGTQLPEHPDSKALEAFLLSRLRADPEAFPDLSLTIIKLLGRGEYVVAGPAEEDTGHFALALSEYTHFTAPNRRFPDLIAQRQCKAFLSKLSLPYSISELKRLADHCTQQEDAVMRVERQLNKSAAAAYLSPQIGQSFYGIITGVTEKGTWVRLFKPAIEGKVIQGFERLKVGQRVTVQLKSVNVAKGFIDFAVIPAEV